uniref:Uncharacterized protein n=1 Tax=Panagrolaimus sp. PS1159 TaxID=55785 RepID=A0AC35ETR2_9BILA
MFLFGLAMVGMINTTFYSKIETSFFGFIDILEKGLERIHRERQTDGYATFLQLSNLFKIAAFAIPNIGYMGVDVEYDSKGRRSIGIQVGGAKAETTTPTKPNPAILGRMHSERINPTRKVSIPKRLRAPTLGVFGHSVEPVIVKVTNSSKDNSNV